MRHGSLFSGIGGFDLAAEWMGWENVFHCEWNEFGQKVLKYYWPGAESFTDITKTDFKKYANKIDVLTGGFPCQPFSTAGKRKGKEDERYLWHEMLRAIQEIKPKFVIAENVYNITNIDGGLVFEQVCVDLENEGYEIQPFIIPACAKNAPHVRQRIWFIAFYTNSKFNGLEHGNEPKYVRGEKKKTFGQRDNITDDITTIGKNESVANTNCTSTQCRDGNAKEKRQDQGRRIESFGFNMEWEKFPTESPICGRDDGLPTELDGITFSRWRNESIKAYGNAIVPQVAYEIFKVLQHIDDSLK